MKNRKAVRVACLPVEARRHPLGLGLLTSCHQACRIEPTKADGTTPPRRTAPSRALTRAILLASHVTTGLT
ncbi:hypothetical protein J6590_017490 [Homalodisca vitripennis]|nr:hypothetical protein J6590_017490 [Homalodisca vitripennis]